MKLLHHTTESTTGISPFDEAILQVSASGSIKIACPYVGIAYLERVIGVSREWQLISDVEEWLSSLRPRERAKAWAFIQVNISRIRNLKGLHAKTVIGPIQAYIGSANLTNMGIYGRTELGVLIDDPANIAQLHVWFGHLWVYSDPLDLSEVQRYVDWRDKVAATTSQGGGETPTLFTSVPKIRAKPALIPNVINVLTPLPSKKEKQIQEAVFLIDKERDSSFLQQHVMAAEPAVFRDIDSKKSNIRKIQKSDVLKVEKKEHVEKIERVNCVVNGSLLDVDEYVLNYINSKALTGFTFAQLCQAVPKGYVVRRRKLYSALMVFCATRPRSIFWEDAVNRLVFVKGRFQQSTHEDIKALLQAYDRLFLILVTTLSFDQQRSLPKLVDLPAIEGLHAGLQRQLLKEMQYSKMVAKAEIGWLLNPFFIWLPRLKLLECSYGVWQKKLKELHAHKKQSMVSTVTMPSFVIKKQSMDEPIAAEIVSLSSCVPIVPASDLVTLDASPLNDVLSQPDISMKVGKSYEIILSKKEAINFSSAKEQELDQENERHNIKYGKAKAQYVLGGVAENSTLMAKECNLSWASSYLCKIDAVYVALLDKILEFNNPLPMKDINALQRVLAMNPSINLPIMRLVIQEHPRRGLPIKVVCHNPGEVYVVKRRSSSEKK